LYISFQPGDDKAGSAYTPVVVTPAVADYSINPNLSNVVNLDQFPNLTAEQKKKLASNGFVVTPGKQEQLFYIYEDNTYKKIPNFVTTDSVLQVYHIFYDYALRSAEGMTLLPNAAALNTNMLVRLQKDYAAISDSAVKPKLKRCWGIFGVAQLAFGRSAPCRIPRRGQIARRQRNGFVQHRRRPASISFVRVRDRLFVIQTPRTLYTERSAGKVL
jgi:hypothetical protein